MATFDESTELLLADVDAWRTWLAEHHGESDGTWLVLSRKGGTATTLTYDQALDEALCVGWIDGQVRSRDEHSFRQRWTPRRSKSPWSARNVEHIARLGAAGRLQPAGVAAVEAAKADGRWDVAYAGPATAEMPADLLAAIATDPAAQAMLEVLTRGNKYALIYRVNEAKRADTRARRIEQFVAMLARGETFHAQKKRPKLP